MATKTQSATHTTVTVVSNTQTCTPPSIRSILRGGLLANRPVAEMRSDVATFHPQSAANLKFAKHLAWYKATLKKEGLLPVVVADTDEV